MSIQHIGHTGTLSTNLQPHKKSFEELAKCSATWFAKNEDKHKT